MSSVIIAGEDEGRLLFQVILLSIPTAYRLSRTERVIVDDLLTLTSFDLSTFTWWRPFNSYLHSRAERVIGPVRDLLSFNSHLLTRRARDQHGLRPFNSYRLAFVSVHAPSA